MTYPDRNQQIPLPLRVARSLIPPPSPLALHRVEPFWKGASWSSELAQRSHGCRQRPEGSQLHPDLWGILLPARVLRLGLCFRRYERAAPECDWKGFLDLIVRSSLLVPKPINHRG